MKFDRIAIMCIPKYNIYIKFSENVEKKLYRCPQEELYVIGCHVGGESYAVKEVITYYQN